MKRIIFVLAFLFTSVFNAMPASAKPEYTTPPIDPFDANKYCFHSGCPIIYPGAKIIALITDPMWPMMGTAPLHIPFIYIALDNNDGYSNWWEAIAFLVSETGVRIPLGQAEADDGNEYKAIKVSCEPYWNPCSPSFSWFRTIIPATAPTGTYALEVQFIRFDGKLDAVHTFGPNFIAITAKTAPTDISNTVKDISNTVCKNAGRKKNVDGNWYACLKKGKRLAWQRLS